MNIQYNILLRVFKKNITKNNTISSVEAHITMIFIKDFKHSV